MKAGGAVQASIKGVAKGSALWTGGKIAKRIPSVDLGVPDKVKDLNGVDTNDSVDQVIGQTADALESTPLPKQVEIRRLFESDSYDGVERWLSESPGTEKFQRGVTYLKRTGERGKIALASVSDRARTALVRLKQYPSVQQRLTTAIRTDRLSSSAVVKVSRRFQQARGATRDRLQSLVAAEGPDAVTVMGTFDSEVVDELVDLDISQSRRAAAVDGLVNLDSDPATAYLCRAIQKGSSPPTLELGRDGDLGTKRSLRRHLRDPERPQRGS